MFSLRKAQSITRKCTYGVNWGKANSCRFSLSALKYQHCSGSHETDANSYKLYAPFAFALVALATLASSTFKSENCGIVGVVGSDDANSFVLEGLTILRNRGYDSAGIATVSADSKTLYVTKYASRESTCDSIDLVKSNCAKHVGHITGIGHTRWATHGGKTDLNAHPHTDYKDRVAIIHNGTINNSYDLKKELKSKGIAFKSETDTEVIAHLIGLYLDEGKNTKDAVSHALSRYCDSLSFSYCNTC